MKTKTIPYTQESEHSCRIYDVAAVLRGFLTLKDKEFLDFLYEVTAGWSNVVVKPYSYETEINLLDYAGMLKRKEKAILFAFVESGGFVADFNQFFLPKRRDVWANTNRQIDHSKIYLESNETGMRNSYGYNVMQRMEVNITGDNKYVCYQGYEIDDTGDERVIIEIEGSGKF